MVRRRVIVLVGVMCLLLAGCGLKQIPTMQSDGMVEDGSDVKEENPLETEEELTQEAIDNSEGKAEAPDQETMDNSDGKTEEPDQEVMDNSDGKTEEPSQEKLDSSEENEQEEKKRPLVKGIYVSAKIAGSSEMDSLIALIDETDLNTVVIDIKDDEGYLTFETTIAGQEEKLSCSSDIADITELMEKLKEHDIYSIARIVCFKDSMLCQKAPELALHGKDGRIITNASGTAWVNPYSRQVWTYLGDIAEKANEVGFDEIQFDYVRFPVGSEARHADYGVDTSVYTSQSAISSFMSYMAGRLHGKGIVFGADVFGAIIGNEEDAANTGQNYGEIARLIDVISPMIYPSHYGPGYFGLDVPDAKPYETVLGALQESKEELSIRPDDENAIIRPWLQCFTASWVEGHISYGEEEINAQIQAVYDAGYEEWILWNAANHYSKMDYLTMEE